MTELRKTPGLAATRPAGTPGETPLNGRSSRSGRRAATSEPRPPSPKRTGRARTPETIAPLPAGASGWMRRARRLSAALERAIADAEIDDSTRSAIERAFAAFELGFTDREIARVAHLVETAHTGIRETPRRDLEGAYLDCARVLYRGLPRVVRRGVELDDVIDIVRMLRREPSLPGGVMEGTARLLGWMETARAHATQAVIAARGRKSASPSNDGEADRDSEPPSS